MTDLDRLDALAGAATPEQGNWWSVEFLRLFENEDDEPIIDMVDAEFIAACDPATIRELVAAVRERDELRAALERIAEGDPLDDGTDLREWVEWAQTDAYAALHHEDGA